MMRGAGHGIKFEAPLYQEKYSLVVFTFIDNTDIVEGYLTRTEITFEYIYISMHKSIKNGVGGIKATGGAIRPDKSFVYHISFKWGDRGD